MKVPSYLLLVFLFVQTAHAYTVILKSGKRISGVAVGEHESTIVIQDASGVFISFKKDALDLSAMAQVNSPVATQKMPERSTVHSKQRSIAEIASESKKNRSGKGRSFTQADHPRGGISVLGSNEPDATPELPIIEPSEHQWQSRIARIKKEVNSLRERKISADAACESSKQKQLSARTTPGKRPVDLLATYQQTPACSKAKEIDRQLTEAETRLDLLREEGRRAGVSWQSLE
jgi:hypothetical protein